MVFSLSCMRVTKFFGYITTYIILMTDDKFVIDIKGLFPKLEEHLDIQGNRRVVFSGAFGIGKTYFLNEFFEEHKEEYECFHLFPVNYQIGSNEDIIQFLKYDILVELTKKYDSVLQEDDYNSFVDLQRLLYFWGKDNLWDVFKTAVYFVPKLGRPLKDTVGLTEKFWDFKKKIEAGDRGVVEKLLEEIKKNNISEEDYLSALLKEKISYYKGDKRSVLILDDLDRVDPAHIFRILNIFSAHYDLHNRELANKFGFDGVVLVADVDNLRSIFHHIYGENTDFNGYFDKFYSVEIFRFRNEEIIQKAVDDVLKHFIVEDIDSIGTGITGQSGFAKLIIADVLERAIYLNSTNKLNLRNLLKGTEFPLPAFKKGVYRKPMVNGRDQAVPQLIRIAVQALVSIFSGMDVDLLSVLSGIKASLIEDDKKKKNYLLFIHYLLQSIDKRFDNKHTYQWGGYRLAFNQAGELASVSRNDPYLSSNAVVTELYFDLLMEYVKKNLHNGINDV